MKTSLFFANFFTEILEAISGSYSLPLFTRRVAEVFQKFLPLQAFELGCASDQMVYSIYRVCFQKAGDLIQEESREIHDSAFGKIQESQKYYWKISLKQAQSSLEEIQGKALGTPYLWMLPLFKNQQKDGFVCFYLKKDIPDFLEIEKPLTKLLSLAYQYIQLVEKLAKISRNVNTDNRQLRKELERYHGKIVARSLGMQAVLQKIELVAPHSTTVLIRGESGTGKELVARQIHARSHRANKPFIAVNCGAIPETIVESELFGYEKGAFTGAINQHRGRFERAEGGTLFLDEIGDLPFASQVKLLRVLQEGEIERVGGEKTIPVHVMVIAATNRPLEQLVQEGQFREDLYYRLNIFPIDVPPLRERKEDIYELIQQLLQQIATRLNKPVPSLLPTMLESLIEHSWPGNVRELANVLERSLILSSETSLHYSFSSKSIASHPTVEKDSYKETFEEASRRCIEKALFQCHGKIYGKNGAAFQLGLKPSTLQSKMKKLKITYTR